MINLSTGEWIAVVGIGIATIISLIQILRNKGSDTLNINQKSGFFSKGKQKVNVKVDKK
jgi:D-arabinose 1-dehydrogenase-like Zn-dependent alcohol dehydrogenase